MPRSGGLRRSRRGLAGLAILGLIAGGAGASVRIATGDRGSEAIEVAQLQPGSPGPALRAAIAALEAGEFQRADGLLEGVAARHALIADYADLLRLRLRVDSGAHREAVELAASWQHPDSPLQVDYFGLLATAHSALGDAAAARGAWEDAIAVSGDRDRLAALRLQLAKSFARDGQHEAAAAQYLNIWTAHPLSPQAEAADAALDKLRTPAGEDLRTGNHYRKRGDTLYRRHRNEPALAAYDRALASGSLSPAEIHRTQSQRAQTLFRLRRYHEAAAAFGQLPADDETRIFRARAFARAGDVPRAVRDLEKIGRESRERTRPRANLLAALLREEAGEPSKARALYEKIVRAAPRSSYAGGALWRLGWSAFREGRYDDAKGYFERILQRDGEALAALRERYWLARAQERSGDPEAAAAFGAIARDYPFSYYGWRAGLRVGKDVEPAPGDGIPEGTAALGAADLARPQILLEAGLEAEARSELDRLFLRARGLGDRLALSHLYTNAGDFHRPQRLIVDAYAEPLARGPIAEQLDLWWHAWPAAFSEDVRRATSNGSGPDQRLVYALMREESGYRPSVVSISGARGLLQIMPETGERLARDAELADFSVDDLFLPHVNIKLGSHYLAELLERFDGRNSVAIASYNAGPLAVSRWLDPGVEDDVWVESIPYDQTRAYVKRVLRSLHVYRVLY